MINYPRCDSYAKLSKKPDTAKYRPIKMPSPLIEVTAFIATIRICRLRIVVYFIVIAIT